MFNSPVYDGHEMNYPEWGPEYEVTCWECVEYQEHCHCHPGSTTDWMCSGRSGYWQWDTRVVYSGIRVSYSTAATSLPWSHLTTVSTVHCSLFLWNKINDLLMVSMHTRHYSQLHDTPHSFSSAKCWYITICVYKIFDQSLLIIEILNEVVALVDDNSTFESELQNIEITCWTWSCCWLNKNRQNNSLLLWREQSHPSRQLIITDPDTKIWNTLLHLSFIMTHALLFILADNILWKFHGFACNQIMHLQHSNKL